MTLIPRHFFLKCVINCLLAITSTLPSQSFLMAETKLIHGELPRKYLEVIEWHCYDCHGEGAKKGGFTIDDLSFRMNTVESAEKWQKVLNAINAGEMPPKDKEQLSVKDKTELLSDLSRQLVIARKALSDTGGKMTIRRLNRREYKNTIEALLGVKVDVQDLPDDSGSSGFDTQGASLYFSGDQFEQYLKIARKALDQAFDHHAGRKQGGQKKANKKISASAKSIQRKRIEVERDVFKWIASDFQRRNHKLKGKSFTRKDDKTLIKNAPDNMRWLNHVAWLKHPLSKTGSPLYNFFFNFALPAVKLPKDGVGKKFVIRVRTGLMNHSVPAYRRYLEYGAALRGTARGELGLAGFHKVSATVNKPEIIEFDYTPVTSDELSLLIRQRHFNQLSAAKRFFRDHVDATGKGPEPALWIDWIEWEGPYEINSDKAAYKIPGGRNINDSNQRRLIEDFAAQAFRTKQPGSAFIDQLMSLNVGHGIDSLKERLAIILATPGFLYLNEPVHGGAHGIEHSTEHAAAPRKLSSKELAVRLSYFLWSSPPDQQLRQVAESGKLLTSKTLQSQTLRMLSDSRIDEFISGFTHQWLHMERLDFFQFDYNNFPQFDDSLKYAARHEVYETIKDALHHHRSIGDLLKSDHIVVNNIMADYYGIKGVTGEHYRRVPVPEGLPRGGLLGMAAVMAMGSDGERASPVERGVWVLRYLLNNPPPPAPANVPQLSRFDGKIIDSRTLARKHQEMPQCTQCHRKIDPIGFGLHNFDAAGQWREQEVIKPIVSVLTDKQKKRDPNWRKKIPKPGVFRIDASGTMPNGQRFRDYFQLRDLIAAREDQFARGFTEKLIAYGLGRPYSFADAELSEQILARAKRKDYALSEFLIALVESTAFQNK